MTRRPRRLALLSLTAPRQPRPARRLIRCAASKLLRRAGPEGLGHSACRGGDQGTRWSPPRLRRPPCRRSRARHRPHPLCQRLDHQAFTAMAVGQQVDAGRMRWDDPLTYSRVRAQDHASRNSPSATRDLRRRLRRSRIPLGRWYRDLRGHVAAAGWSSHCFVPGLPSSTTT
jgi:hypothetical protein